RPRVHQPGYRNPGVQRRGYFRRPQRASESAGGCQADRSRATDRDGPALVEMTMKRRTRTRAYTAIEVLMAMSVFAIGAAAIIGMMRAAIQGNYDARRLDQANSLAREWMERLRRDGMLWTTATNLTATTFLNAYRDAPAGWVLPVNACPA